MDERIKKYLVKLEKRLMVEKGKWVADFCESFWGERVAGEKFLMYMEGNTRPKGFLLSKFASYMLTPNYRVGVFVKNVEEDRDVKKLLEKIRIFMKKRDMEWSWILLLKEGNFSKSLIKFVEEDKNPKMGIGLLNLNKMDIISNDGFLGRQMKKYFLVKI